MSYFSIFASRKNTSDWGKLGYLVLFLLFGLLFQGIIIGFGTIFFSIENEIFMRIAQIISTFFIFMVPAIVFSASFSSSCISYSSADKVAPTHLVGIVLILSLLILPIILCLGTWNEAMQLPESWSAIENWLKETEDAASEAIKIFTQPPTLWKLALNIVMIALAPALFEEFLFRGTLQPLLSSIFKNKHVAIIVTAFIFSAIHFQFYGFLPRFIIGIYLGYLMIWSQSLWLPIIAHFMHNSISLIFDYGLQIRGIIPESVQLENLSFFYPLVSICTVFAVVAIFFLHKNRVKQ